MDPSFAQGLHDLLQQTLSPDTTKLKAATTSLNQDYYKNPACISALASIIASSPDQAVRQLAAVEMRKRVAFKSGSLWIALPQAEREQIKERFPALILEETNGLVRHATARVIAAIAGIELPEGTWNGLFPLLQQAVASPQSVHREVGSYILYSILESVVSGFNFPDLFAIFQQTIQDPENLEVRITTVRSLGCLAQWIDSDEKAHLNTYQTLVPAMLQVMGQCVEAGDEAGARHLFDVLETLLILEIPLLSKSIPDLVQFLLQCGGNRNYEQEIRVLALNAMNWTVQYKKSKLQNLGLAPVILEHLMPLTTEDEPEDGDEEAPSRSALRIIDTLSTSLPPSQVFPALRTLILQYFQSPDPARRRGAILALGISVEGCSEFMTPRMSEVWPILESALQDSDASVRKAACIAVSCFCEWLDEECAAKHSVLVPAIMNLINDPLTQKAACTALDALLEILADVIDQYLTLIMERLGGLLQSAPLNVKAVVTGAIGSAAHASKENFIPYFQPTMQVLQHFLVLTNEGEEIELRGITMDAIGTFAEAVGKENFRPYFPDMMKQAFSGIETGSSRLRECSFLFFSVMARVFGEEFAPYLENVIPPLLASFKQSEGADEIDVSDAAAAFDSGSSPSNAITLTDTDENGMPSAELEDVDLDKLLDVNSAIAVEKEIAADTIGTLFTSTGTAFFPYVESCVVELVALLSHYYEGIRKSALDSLLEITRTFYDLNEHAEWEPSSTVKTPYVGQIVVELVSHTIAPLLEMYDTEDNKSVVSSLCVGFAETIQKVGPVFIDGHVEELCNMAKEILEQKAYCQQDPDQDEDEEAPEDQAEYDSVLISSAGDLVAAMATAMGNDFIPAFDTFFPLIAKFYKTKRSLSERSSSIGCLAEIIGGLKSGVTPWTESLYTLFIKALGDQEAEVLSNAAFAVGLLVEHSETDMSGQYLTLLGALRPLFNVSADSPAAFMNAKDNAAGAVARMIVKNTNALPLDQVLPVFVNALPLKNDYLENRPVFRAIFFLFSNHGSLLFPYMDHLLQVFASVLDPSGPDQVGDEIRADLIRLIGALNQQDPAKVSAAGLTAFASA